MASSAIVQHPGQRHVDAEEAPRAVAAVEEPARPARAGSGGRAQAAPGAARPARRTVAASVSQERKRSASPRVPEGVGGDVEARRSSRSPLDAARLAPRCPEASAERTVTRGEGQHRRARAATPARGATAGSRRRQSQSSVRRSERALRQRDGAARGRRRRRARSPRRSAITSIRVPVEEHADDRHAR